MTEDQHTEHSETLGEYLRRLRIEKNAEIEDVLEETKISQKALRAMETDDYSLLPPDAFARGFYSLYAKFLEIEPKIILDRYDEEITAHQQQGSYSPPMREGRKVNSLAARPSMITGSLFGFSLVISIGVAAIICWYFSWNPATFLSEKLRSLQKPAVTEALLPDASQGDAANSSEKTEKVLESKYFLTIEFLEDTTITISTDNSIPEERIFTRGSTRSWYANETLSLILPESAKVELYFNGYQIDMPEPANGLISLTLP